MAKLLTLSVLFVTLALASAEVDATPNESEDEPRMDEEVNLLGLSDDALDEDDELDRADETDEQADPSDRRSIRSCRRGWKKSSGCYKRLRCRARNCACHCYRRSCRTRRYYG